MRFGGHETFPVREGWLHKGLKLVVEEPGKLTGEHVADWLEVGRNMAKSIRYWLQAAGLCEQVSGRRHRKGAPGRSGERLLHDPGKPVRGGGPGGTRRSVSKSRDWPGSEDSPSSGGKRRTGWMNISPMRD